MTQEQKQLFKQIIKAIKKEIKWNKKNYINEPYDERLDIYNTAFVDGLKHAKFVVKELRDELEENTSNIKETLDTCKWLYNPYTGMGVNPHAGGCANIDKMDTIDGIVFCPTCRKPISIYEAQPFSNPPTPKEKSICNWIYDTVTGIAINPHDGNSINLNIMEKQICCICFKPIVFTPDNGSN